MSHIFSQLEHKNGIDQLREEIRRSDDRSAKNFSDMSQLHNKEMERLHNLILTMIARDPSNATFNSQFPMQQYNQQFAMQQQVAQQQAAAQQQVALQVVLQRQMEAMALANQANQKAATHPFATPLQQQLISTPAAPRPQAPTLTPVVQPVQAVVPNVPTLKVI